MKAHFSTLANVLNPRTFIQFGSLPEGAKDGFYPGVLVIEVGPAKGHFAVKTEGGQVVNYDPSDPEHAKLQKYPIYIGETTLDDVVKCGNESDLVKSKFDHGVSAKDIIGHYVKFRRDGNQVRADLEVMDSTPHRAHVVELISKLSKKIGNSIDFDYRYEIQGSKAIARCVVLNSVDLVDAPAATNSFFTKQQPDNPQYDMPLSPEDVALIRGAVKDEVGSQLGAVKTEFNAKLDEIKTKMDDGSGGGDDDPEKKKKKDDDDGDKNGNAGFSAKDMKTAVMAGIREILPQAVVANLATFGAGPAKDEYAEKHAAAMAMNMTAPEATRYMARKFPALYTAKHGGGEGGRGSASTKNTKL